MIQFRQLSLRRGATILLENVNWTIHAGQHIGLIGANGAGKSSLFALITGQLHEDQGNVTLPKQQIIAHVAQEMPAETRSALEYVLDGDRELRALQQQLIIAEENNDGHRIAELHGALQHIDAWTAPARAGRLLNGLGFHATEQQQSVNAFSGGWRMRLNLAQALMCRSDILLLDEPTNHLDLDAVIWLGEWLKEYRGTLLLISHDRDFLDETVQFIAHIEHKNLHLYTGNYSDFEKSRAEKLALQQAAFAKQQQHITHLKSFIDRFKAKASKAKQAQSRVKALDRLEIIQAVQAETPFQFEFREPDHAPNPLLQLNHAKIGYGDHIIFEDLTFSIAPGERIALLGPNGAGKSTLIKALSGDLQPIENKREIGHGLSIGHFAQHHVDHLLLDQTPLQHLQKIAENTREQVLRSFLGSFGFSHNRVYESIKNFSGGEKSRLALALIIWKKPNLLLLDEPTNHLDMDMRNALSLALQSWSGAVVLVSHDRFLVRATAEQLFLIANGKLQPFNGDLTDYEKWLINFRREQNIEKKLTQPNNQKQLQQLIQKLENQIEKCQKQFSDNEKLLADTEMYTEQKKEKLQFILKNQQKIQKELLKAEEDWLAACEKRDDV